MAEKRYECLSVRHTGSGAHLSCRLLENVLDMEPTVFASYEPDQDSFLFLDSLEKEYSFLQQLDPFVVLEIGPGSGIISTFLTRLISTLRFLVLS